MLIFDFLFSGTGMVVAAGGGLMLFALLADALQSEAHNWRAQRNAGPMQFHAVAVPKSFQANTQDVLLYLTFLQSNIQDAKRNLTVRGLADQLDGGGSENTPYQLIRELRGFLSTWAPVSNVHGYEGLNKAHAALMGVFEKMPREATALDYYETASYELGKVCGLYREGVEHFHAAQKNRPARSSSGQALFAESTQQPVLEAAPVLTAQSPLVPTGAATGTFTLPAWEHLPPLQALHVVAGALAGHPVAAARRAGAGLLQPLAHVMVWLADRPDSAHRVDGLIDAAAPRAARTLALYSRLVQIDGLDEGQEAALADAASALAELPHLLAAYAAALLADDFRALDLLVKEMRAVDFVLDAPPGYTPGIQRGVLALA